MFYFIFSQAISKYDRNGWRELIHVVTKGRNRLDGTRWQGDDKEKQIYNNYNNYTGQFKILFHIFFALEIVQANECHSSCLAYLF